MPTVLVKDGFRFMIYTEDHEPAHVHVFKGGEKAKINIKPVALVYAQMKPRAAKKAVKITEDHQDYLFEKWREIHG